MNKAKVAASDGLLAPITGSEKYLSATGGHFEAFCKASIAGCKTSEPAVANDVGCVDLEKLKRIQSSRSFLRMDGLAESFTVGLKSSTQGWLTSSKGPAIQPAVSQVTVLSWKS